MYKSQLLLQGGLGNQVYQLFALELFSLNKNIEKTIDDKTLFELDFEFKRKATYQNLVKRNYQTKKISWINLFFIKIIRKLAKYGCIKPLYFDSSTNDIIFSFKNITYLWGYFQNDNWFHQFDKKIITRELKKFIDDFLIHEKKVQVALHIRHLQVKSRYDDAFYIRYLESIPLNLNTIYISAEDSSWAAEYSDLYKYLLDKKYMINSSYNLSSDIEYMVGSTHFVPAQSTLSDWLLIYRAHNGKENDHLTGGYFSNLLNFYLAGVNNV